MENKINLLFVDDEEQFLASLTKQLAVRDFNVVAVDRGDKALDAADEMEIDIALVDLKMPGMNGEETLRSLKKKHPWMEIVILTGHGTPDAAADTMLSGAYAYLMKPCRLNELLDVLKSAYKKKVMNKNQIEEKRMNQLLKLSESNSPKDILKRLKEIDRSGP
ncbi:MAG: response regulator [Thermodesulfobacteriota bacterium]